MLDNKYGYLIARYGWSVEGSRESYLGNRYLTTGCGCLSKGIVDVHRGVIKANEEYDGCKIP